MGRRWDREESVHQAVQSVWMKLIADSTRIRMAPSCVMVKRPAWPWVPSLNVRNRVRTLSMSCSTRSSIDSSVTPLRDSRYLTLARRVGTP